MIKINKYSNTVRFQSRRTLYLFTNKKNCYKSSKYKIVETITEFGTLVCLTFVNSFFTSSKKLIPLQANTDYSFFNFKSNNCVY